MQSMKSVPVVFYSFLNHLSSNLVRSSLLSFSTGSLSTQGKYSKESTFLIDYLNANFKWGKSQFKYISINVSRSTFPQKPLSVLNYFKDIGFSETQIQYMISQRAQILFSDVDKTLRPKIGLFQQLGLEGPELRKFIYKNPSILTSSLEKQLVPAVEAIKKFARDEKDLIQVLCKCGWILSKSRKLVNNIAFLESWGIVGSQLSVLFKRQSRLLSSPQSTLRNHVLRAIEMGFHKNSKMLVHALQTRSALSYKTFRRKLDFIERFGFSKDESLYMFRRCPALLRTSEKKLKAGMEFFLHTVMLPKSVLVHRPMILMYSMEDRVLPRYQVLQLLISKKLCKKVPTYMN